MQNKNDIANESNSKMKAFFSAKQAETGYKKFVRTIIKALPFAIRLVFKSAPFLLILLGLITILSGLMPTATVYVGRLVLDAIANVIQTNSSSKEVGILLRAFTLQLIVFMSSVMLTQANSFLNYLMGKRLSLKMTADVLRRVSRLDYEFFENSQFYDMMTRAKRESSGKPLVLVYEINSIVRNSITFFSMGILIASFNFFLFVVMVIVCVPLLLIKLRYGEKNYSLQYTRTKDMRMATYIADIMGRREYVPEILSFGLGQYLLNKWYTISQKLLHQDIQLYRKQNVAQILTRIFMTCGTIAATGYIIYISVTRELSLTIGDIMMYSGAFTGGLLALRTAFEGISGIYENALFLHDLIEFNEVEPRIEIMQHGKPVPSIIKSIELQNVSFKYPSSQQYALKNINLTFKHSASTLLVGTNGSGKTTLVKLLMRLYDPTKGRILLNDTDIREFKIESLRKNIGIMFQEFIRYAFSVKENIGCGSIDYLENMERIITAAKRVKADTFIKHLPRQYDDILSKLFENGQELSLGQWQSICLARLFMKRSSVLIFDEPTASLDIETEAHLFREITRLTKNKICILISHHMLRRGIADKIVVLDNGEIAEVGTHEYLVTQNGKFAKLLKLYHNTAKEQLVNL